MLKKFVLGGMVVVAALLGNACGDDGSSDSPAGPADSEVTLSSSSDDVVSGNGSSSSVTESPSTSSGQAPQSAESDGSSSSEKAVDGSSSSDGKASSSSGKVESSSSGKGEKSSSSEGAAGSSSAKVEDSSSSAKVDESSSSMKAAESSSSVKVEESSSSEKNEASSSSENPVESSSSEKVVESSSSEVSSSSVVQPCKTKTEDNCIYGTLYDDRDGKTYKTVKIGEQWWMAENLNYETDSLRPSARSVCHPDPDTCAKYGRLYFWNIAMDTLNTGCGKYVTCKPSEPVQGVCPKGWHIPSELEMIVLLNNVGGEKINAAQNLRASDSWTSPVKCSSIDPYGFSALAAGLYYNTNYQDFHAETRFTLSSEYDKERRKVLVITSYSSTELGCPKKTAEIEYFWNKSNTASVRCIKD